MATFLSLPTIACLTIFLLRNFGDVVKTRRKLLILLFFGACPFSPSGSKQLPSGCRTTRPAPPKDKKNHRVGIHGPPSMWNKTWMGCFSG